jgi:CTP:molybdopterin cytidylyltransferase MocA
MMSSVREGVSALPFGTHALVWPVDHPYVTDTTIREMIAAASAASLSEDPADIVVPTYLGYGGHPVLFAPTLFGEILALDDRGGLDRLLLAHAARVRRLPVLDEGVLRDVDSADALI